MMVFILLGTITVAISVTLTLIVRFIEDVNSMKQIQNSSGKTLLHLLNKSFQIEKRLRVIENKGKRK